MIHNWGVNDSDSPVRSRNPKWVCPIYSTWARMVERCHSEREQKRNPTYKGCTIVDEWKYFSKFKSWMETQDWKGNQLDKDLLFEGNKEYGPNTCLFVSRQVNSFMTKSDASRGSLPLGVVQGTHSYAVQCCGLDGVNKYVGSYKTVESAVIAYKLKKFEYALELASRQTNDKVSQALINKYQIKE